MTSSRIENVSDTARWVAFYRALESERPDAHFRDPFARKLAGERGEAIMRAMPNGRSWGWPMVVRTCVMDEIILRTVRGDKTGMVVNLAAGLDARPFRLSLPSSLRWVDVDLPEILDYKKSVLDGASPTCEYEVDAVDLTDAARRRDLFSRLGAADKPTLILSEGLLVYLDPGQVRELANDLHAPPSFRWWLIDLASPRLLQMIRRRWGQRMTSAPMKFAPAEGTAFFESSGWKEAEFRSIWDESHRLKREMSMAWLWRFLGRFSPPERQEEFRRMSGIVLLERK